MPKGKALYSSRLKAGIHGIPQGHCPKCMSERLFYPRTRNPEEVWVHCYRCKHEWRASGGTKRPIFGRDE